MNIHLVEDEKFINYSFETFENYYPDQNVFFVKVGRGFNGKLEYIEPNDRIIPTCMYEQAGIDRILEYCDMDDTNIFVHYLEGVKASTALTLRDKTGATLYWISYGADLYQLLERKGMYELKDYPVNTKRKYTLREFLVKAYEGIIKRINFGRVNLTAAMDEFVHEADFFCFWNHYDYRLLKEHISSTPDFKYFRYFDAFRKDVPERSAEKEADSIIVNHSASLHGNHLTILNKLKKIDSHKIINNIFVPLSYGDETVKEMVLEYGKKNLSYAFTPLEKFLPRNEYHRILKKTGIGFFGHRRQAAAGNIYYLLATGAKIFLRSDNNLLNYYREKGYHLYEFEKDFNAIGDLTLLDEQKQIENREIAQEEFSQKEMDRTYQNLID